MYTPNQFLETAVAEGDPYIVRGAIAGIIQANPQNRGNEVENAVQYAEEHGIALFEADDPSLEIITDEGKWTSAYFASAVTYLQANFTRARLAHVLAVSKKTHQVTPPPAAKPTTTPAAARPVTRTPTSGATAPHTMMPPKKAQSPRGWMAAAGIALVALAVVLAVLFLR